MRSYWSYTRLVRNASSLLFDTQFRSASNAARVVGAPFTSSLNRSFSACCCAWRTCSSVTCSAAKKDRRPPRRGEDVDRFFEHRRVPARRRPPRAELRPRKGRRPAKASSRLNMISRSWLASYGLEEQLLVLEAAFHALVHVVDVLDLVANRDRHRRYSRFSFPPPQRARGFISTLSSFIKSISSRMMITESN